MTFRQLIDSMIAVLSHNVLIKGMKNIYNTSLLSFIIDYRNK